MNSDDKMVLIVVFAPIMLLVVWGAIAVMSDAGDDSDWDTDDLIGLYEGKAWYLEEVDLSIEDADERAIQDILSKHGAIHMTYNVPDSDTLRILWCRPL